MCDRVRERIIKLAIQQSCVLLANSLTKTRRDRNSHSSDFKSQATNNLAVDATSLFVSSLWDRWKQNRILDLHPALPEHDRACC